MLISTCLVEDVEVGVGEPIGPDSLKQPPERRGVGYVRGRAPTRAAGQHAADAATNVGDYGARVAGLRKRPRLAVVADYRPFHGGLADGHVQMEVLADDGEDAVRAAERGASGTPALDHQQARLAFQAPHIGFSHQLVGDGAVERK